MKKIKVLEVFGEPILNGGQESFVVNFLHHMNRENLNIDVLTPYECKNEHYIKLLKDIHIKVIFLNYPFIQGHFSLKIWIKLNQYLEKKHYDVVHIHSGSILALSLISLAARFHKVKKIIVHSHAGMQNETLKHIIVKTFSFPIMSWCPTEYCACSMEAGIAKFPKRIIKNKLKIIKNGIDLNLFSYDENIRKKVRELYYIQEDTFLIGHVGRFSYEKNHSFLLDVFEKLNKINKNTKLILIGDGPLKNRITRKIEMLHLEHSVILCGSISNVHEIMQAMDLFVLPSRFEGFGIVGLEAQALGLPVIASDKVPKDLKITGLVSYMSLENSADIWAVKIQEKGRIERRNYQDHIKSAGYSIVQTARIVEDLYRK